jgi:DNA modification methylase
MQKEQEKVNWTLHNKSCLDICSDYPDNYFKVCITSPPYKSKDGYSDELMSGLASKLLRVIKSKGLTFINFGSLAESWQRPFDVARIFKEAGFLDVTTLIWIKSLVFPALQDLPGSLGKDVQDIVDFCKTELLDAEDVDRSDIKRLKKHIITLEKLLSPRQVGHYTPIGDKRRMNNLFEYIFVFAKDELPELDRLSLPNGVPYADLSNLTRGTRGKNGNRHCSGNLWPIFYSTTGKTVKKEHIYSFPEEIVERCLALSGAKPGDIVLDPFCGGGTVLKVSKQLGLSSSGYELNPQIAEQTIKRLNT